MKYIYIVVRVHFDCYRFQDNLYANTSRKMAIEYAKLYRKEMSEKMPIITSKTESYKPEITRNEIEHLWIQKIHYRSEKSGVLPMINTPK